MSSNQLRQDIIDELEFEPSIDASKIGVAVEDGVVTLTGHVSTYIEKATAEEVVGRVRGVKGIAQEIEVRPYAANQTADDEIAKRALQMIGWSVLVPADSVKVKVQAGWLTLNGTVEWQYQKTAAADAVRGLLGVSGITNSIAVEPQAIASNVRKRIEEALKRNAELEANSIRVSVVGGNVKLEGKVNAWAERSAAERAAWSVPGVHTVDDLLAVA